MKTFTRFFSMMLLFAAMAFNVTAVNAATWYVSVVSGNDANDGLTLSTQFKTITHAISVAVNGDIIEVAAGTYTEDITINKKLDIRGANYNINPNDVSWNPNTSRGAESIVVGSLISTPHGFSLNGFELKANSNSPMISFSGGGTPGLISISNNIISGEGQPTNALDNGSGIPFTIENNTFKNFITGSGPKNFVLFFDGGAGTTSSVISGNLFLNNTRNGMIISGSFTNPQTISGNKFDQTASAIILGSGGHTITNNIFANAASGISSYKGNNTITNNVFTSAGLGRGIYSEGGNNTITNKSFTNNNYALWVKTGLGDQVHSNSFLGGDVNGRSIYHHPTTNTLDATCNWWGTADGTLIPAKFYGYGVTTNLVDYTPWLSNGTDNDEVTSGFQPVPNSCDAYVTVIESDGTFKSTYSSITSGINGASLTNRVLIPSGIYNESVVVNKPGVVLAPGSSPGCITVNDLSYASMTPPGVLEIEIDGLTPCTNYDQVTVTNTIDLTNATLSLVNSNNNTYADNSVITIINNTSTSAIIGTFTGAAEGARICDGTNIWVISYIGIDGNDVILTLAATPVWTVCPPDINVNTANGTCSQTVTYTATYESCGAAPDLTYLFTPDPTLGGSAGSGTGDGSGSLFSKGETQVKITATKDSYSATCTFTVTVTDNEEPTIACPSGPIEKNTNSGQCTYTASGVEFDFLTVSDNCTAMPTTTYTLSGATIEGPTTATTLSGVVFERGTTTVLWTADDGNGNSDLCSFDVTVTDKENPSFGTTCPDDQLLNNVSGDCFAQAAWLIPVPTDNCSITNTVLTTSLLVAINNTPSENPTDAFGIFPVGSTTVTYTTYDVAGNSAQCSFVITVVDNEDPKLVTCPANITGKVTAPGQCTSDPISWTPPTASDNCTGFTLTNTHNPNFNFPAGITTVTYTVTDAANRSVSCSFDVEVIDNEVPVVTCPTPANPYFTDAGLGTKSLSILATATDNCGVSSIVYSVSSTPIVFPYDFPTGTTTVDVLVTDIHNKTSACFFDVVVEDPEAPVGGSLTMTTTLYPGGLTATPDVNDVYTIATPLSFNGIDVLQGISVEVKDPNLNTANVPVFINGATTANGEMVYDTGNDIWNYANQAFAPAFTDGVQTITATFSDLAGNLSLMTLNFTTDATAPLAGTLTMTTTLYPSGLTASPVSDVYTITTPLSFNGIDVLQGISLVVTDAHPNSANVPVFINGIGNGHMEYDGVNNIWNYTGQTSAPAFTDGVQVVTATFTDMLGNARLLTLNFTTDATAPEGGLLTMTTTLYPGGLTASPVSDVYTITTPLSFNGIDVLQGISLVVTDAHPNSANVPVFINGIGNGHMEYDGVNNIWNYAGQTSAPAFTDGVQVVTATFTDMLGNSRLLTLNFTTDATAPLAGTLTMTTNLQGALTVTQSGNTYTITEPVAFNGIDVLDVLSIVVTDAHLNTANVPVTFPLGVNGNMVYNAGVWNYVAAVPYVGFNDGPQVVTATFSDLAGNTTLMTLNFTTDTQAPELLAVTPTTGAQCMFGENFVWTVQASDDNLYSLEVDHSMEAILPEFTVYADETDPYGGYGVAFATAGVVVTYSATLQQWTIDFGADMTPAFIANGGITFYVVLKDLAGNEWGSMSPPTSANTFAYTFDTEAPVITLTGDATVYICQDELYTDAGATAFDNCEGNITSKISIVNPINTTVPDSYIITYNVSDMEGNAAIEVTRTVIVNPEPKVTAATLRFADNATGPWTPVSGDLINGYVQCIDPAVSGGYHYFDIDVLTNTTYPLETATFAQNGFKITSAPSSFLTSWNAAGVNASATSGWEAVMYQIITGVEPMFYVKYDGADYTLIDGLQYQNSAVEAPLRINGIYLEGDYTFTGTVTDINGCTSLPFDIDIKFNSVPVINCAPLTVNNDLHVCGASVDFTSFDVTVISGVPVPTVTYEIAGTPITSPHFFPVGTTVVTATATNSCGSVSCDFDMIVIDHEAPRVTGTVYVDNTNYDACYIDAVTPPLASLAFDQNRALTGYGDNCPEPIVAVLTNTLVQGVQCEWWITYTYNVMDSKGNSFTDQEYIHYGSDQTAPVLAGTADCSSLNMTGVSECISTAANWDPVLLYSDVAALYEDACSVTLTVTHIGTVADPSNTDCSWLYTYTYQVEDDCNNSTTCSVTRAGGDTEDPIFITTPGDINVNSGTTFCGATVSWNLPTYTDNCDAAPVLTVTYVPAVSSIIALGGGQMMATFDKGVTVVTYTVEDACGHVTSTSFNVTVIDITLPIITGNPGTITVNTTPGLCTAPAFWSNITATDNCPGVVLTSTHSSGNIFPLGPTTVTYTATDASGNISPISFNVVVVDNIAPVLTGTLPGGAMGSVCFANATPAPLESDIAALYFDNCGTVNAILISSVVVDDNCAWTTTYTYTIDDGNGNSAPDAVVVYTGGDITPPVITAAAASASVECTGLDPSLNSDYLAWLANNGGAVATDNCSSVNWSNNASSQTWNGNVNSKSITVTFTATDDCSKVTSTTATFTIVDTTPPEAGALTMSTTLYPLGLTSSKVGNVYTISTPLSFNGIDVLQVFSLKVTDINLNTANVPVTFLSGVNGNMVYDNMNEVWNYVADVPYPAFTDGPQTITATFSDLAGNTTLVTVEFTTDATAPVGGLLTMTTTLYPMPGLTASPVNDVYTITTPLSFNGIDVLQGISLVVTDAHPNLVTVPVFINGIGNGHMEYDGVNNIWNYAGQTSAPAFTDGVQVVTATFTDMLGNSRLLTLNFTTDATAPEGGLLTMTTTLYPGGLTASPVNDVYTIATPLSFNGIDVLQGISLVVTDAHPNSANVPVFINGIGNGHMEYDGVNNIWNYAGQTSAPAFTDGVQVVTATFTDMLGNSRLLTLNFTTDATAPEGGLLTMTTTLYPGGLTASPVNDVYTITTPLSFNGIDVLQGISLVVTDAHPNLLANVPVFINTVENGYLQHTGLGVWNYAGQTAVPPFTDGLQTITATFTDMLGNARLLTLNFTTDATAPEGGLLTMTTTLYPLGLTASPVNDVYTITTPLSFNGIDVLQGISLVVTDAHPNSANVPVFINGIGNGHMEYDGVNNIWNYAGQTGMPPFTDGLQTITATFTDMLGNARLLTLNFTTDATAPVGGLLTMTTTLYPMPGLTASPVNDVYTIATPLSFNGIDVLQGISLVVTDAHPNFANVPVFINGIGNGYMEYDGVNNIWNYAGQTGMPPFTDGVQTITATFTDMLGNSRLLTLNFTTDATAPEGGLLTMTTTLYPGGLTASPVNDVYTIATPLSFNGIDVLQGISLVVTDAHPNPANVPVFINGIGNGHMEYDGVNNIWNYAGQTSAPAFTDGVQTITATFTDMLGNSRLLTLNFTTDATAPEGGLLTMTTTLYPGGLTATPDVNDVYTIATLLSFNGIDVLQGISLVVTDAHPNPANVPVFINTVENGYMAYDAGNAIWNYAGQTAVPPFTDGVQTITATFTDMLGNSRLLTLNFTTDATPPVGGALTMMTNWHPTPGIVVPSPTAGIYTITPALSIDGGDVFNSLSVVVTDLNLNTANVPVIIDGVSGFGYMEHAGLGVWNFVQTGLPDFSAEIIHSLVATFSDNAGNTTKLTAQFMTDHTPPTFTRPIDITIYRDSHCYYNADIAYTGDVTDEADNYSVGEATFSDVLDATNPCNVVITRTWSLKDDCGNPAVDQIQIITVKDNTAPIFTVPAAITLHRDPTTCSYDRLPANTGYPTNISDNCTATPTVTYMDADAQGLCAYDLTITRTWYVEDACGNSSTGVQIIDVLDITAPVLTGTLPGGSLGNVCMNDAPAAPAESTIAALYTENCGNVNVVLLSATLTGTYAGWTATYTYSVADDCGNTVTNAVVVYTGADTEYPVIACATDIYQSTDAGQCSATVTITAPTATDNCSVSSLVGVRSDNLVLTAGYPVGITTILWTATDAAGLVTSCTQTITITDDEYPTITCPQLAASYPTNMGCNYEVVGTEFDAIGYDNCQLVSVTNDYMVPAGHTLAGVLFPIGTTTVTWTAIDMSGNSTTCSIDVVVKGHTVSGTYKYYNIHQTPLNNITVKLTEMNANIPSTYTTTTDATGYYMIEDVCGVSYTVTATTVKPIAGAINSTDALQVNNWGVSQYPIEKVRAIAGDVAPIGIPNGYLDGGDAGRIQMYFLTAGNPSFHTHWTFWNAGQMVSGQNFGTNQVSTINVTGDQTVNFLGLVTGDFNRSFIPGNAKGSANIILTQDKTMRVAAGEEFDLPMTAGFDMEVGAASIILDFPADKVEVLGVYLGEDQTTAVPFNTRGDELRIAWNSLIPVKLTTGDALVTLKLKTRETFTEGASVIFTMIGDPTVELADGSATVIPGAELNIDRIEGTVGMGTDPLASIISLVNYPNPFTTATTFAYTLPVNGKVTLEVYDLIGRKAAELISEDQSAGSYTYTMDTQDLRPGVYTATLRLNTGGATMSRSIKIISHK